MVRRGGRQKANSDARQIDWTETSEDCGKVRLYGVCVPCKRLAIHGVLLNGKVVDKDDFELGPHDGISVGDVRNRKATYDGKHYPNGSKRRKAIHEEYLGNKAFYDADPPSAAPAAAAGGQLPSTAAIAPLPYTSGPQQLILRDDTKFWCVRTICVARATAVLALAVSEPLTSALSKDASSRGLMYKALGALTPAMASKAIAAASTGTEADDPWAWQVAEAEATEAEAATVEAFDGHFDVQQIMLCAYEVCLRNQHALVEISPTDHGACFLFSGPKTKDIRNWAKDVDAQIADRILCVLLASEEGKAGELPECQVAHEALALEGDAWKLFNTAKLTKAQGLFEAAAEKYAKVLATVHAGWGDAVQPTYSAELVRQALGAEPQRCIGVMQARLEDVAKSTQRAAVAASVRAHAAAIAA